MSAPFRLIHVGAGVRGRHWLDFLAEQREFESVACVDVDRDALARVRDKHGSETFTSLPQALGGVAADGVLITSPSAMHAEQAMQALRAGFPVMVEKPLAASLAEAVDVVACARHAGRALVVAENYRFFRAERTLRAFLDEGGVGPVRSAVCIDRRAQPASTQGPWVQRMEEPFLTEIAVHHFDSFRYLFDRRPVSLWTRTYNPPGSDYDRNAAAQSLITMDEGLRIQYSGSFVGSRYDYSLWVYGERGEVRTDRTRVWHRAAGEERYRECPSVAMPQGEALRYPHAGMLTLLRQFRDAVAGTCRAETSGEDNLWTLAMYEAAVRSAREQRYIGIDEVLTEEMRSQAGIASRRDALQEDAVRV